MADILIVDDDNMMCTSLSHVARRLGHEVCCVNSLAAAVEEAGAKRYDIVFLDVRMPDGNGLDFVPALRKCPSEPEIIIMTGFGEAEGAEIAIRSGAWDYIQKGSSTKQINLSLVRALEYRKQKENSGKTIVHLKKEGIVGESPPLQDCLDQVAEAAACDACVLISGDTGTGKELFARAVHSNSSRASGRFIVVDCAALPENLVESLLFGHERGAFTGAEQTREGLVRQAAGGTLFLDEVGELPFGMQKAFLRVLQEHRYRPVGGSRELESNFRLVAATNKDLEAMVGQGSFRQDLLYRLRSFAIDLPPLRERTGDIQALARHHVDGLCTRYALPPKAFSPEFLETLRAYRWPGNVRELVQALERAVASARLEPILFPQHLPVAVRVAVVQSQVRTASETAAEQVSGAPPEQLPKLCDFRDNIYTQAERQYLLDLLSLSGHDLVEACRLSGLSQSRLYALMKTHQLRVH